MSESELNVDIPNVAGWPTQSVDSLCSLISRGTAPVYVEHSEVLAIGQRCVASTGFAPDFARPHSHRAMRNVLKPESGDVLLNSTGTGTIGRSVVFNSPGTFIVDGHVTVMRPRAELADSRWLNSVLRTPALQRHLERFCFAGSTNQLELSRTPLRVSRLPTPHIDDQRAMGLVIDTLDTAILQTEAIIAKLKAVKQGLLHDLLTRGIDANGELRPPQVEAPHLYKESPLGWIPKEWEVQPLQHVADVVDPQPDHRTPREQEQGAPYIGIGDFDDTGDICISTCRKVIWSALEKQERRFTVRSGDIIYGKIGTIGQPKLLPEGRYALTANVFLIQPKRGSSFLFYSIDSRQFEKQILEVTNTTSQPALGIETVRLLGVPCPLVEEADSIAKILDAASNKLASEQRSLKKLRNKKFGLMDDLLTGRVRVTPLLAEAAQQGGA